MAPSGEPSQSPKPQPIGYYPLISLFTVCTLCVLFILWQRANSIRTVVGHQLKTWTNSEGRIRLSEDDGPSSHSFVDNDDEGDENDDADDEPLASRAERLKQGKTNTAITNGTTSPTTITTGTGIALLHPQPPVLET